MARVKEFLNRIVQDCFGDKTQGFVYKISYSWSIFDVISLAWSFQELGCEIVRFTTANLQST